MSLAQARDDAKQIILTKDTNVLEQKTLSVRVLIEEYLSVKSLKASTVEDYRRSIKQLFPAYEKPIQALTKTYTKQWYVSLSSTPTQADRCYRILSGVMNYAVQVGYLSTNPFSIIKPIRYKANVRDTYLEPVKQLPMFWSVLSKRSGITADMIRFYVLTGIRKSEIYKMEVIDDCFVIPNTKNSTTHYIPIKGMLNDLKYLTKDNLTRDVRKTLHSICKEAGCPLISLHSIRRSVASLCDYLGIELGAIKHLLNHSVSGDVTLRHYIQRKTDYLVPVMEKLEAYYSGIA